MQGRRYDFSARVYQRVLALSFRPDPAVLAVLHFTPFTTNHDVEKNIITHLAMIQTQSLDIQDLAL